MTPSLPHAEYSPRADALYVQLTAGGVARTVSLDDRRMIDLDADGVVVGVEFLDVRAGIDLDSIPFRHQVEEAIRGFGFRIFTA